MDDFEKRVNEAALRTSILSGQIPSGRTSSDVLGEALEELRNTVEELQVAQEELRVQNLELESSAVALETERRRYRALFEFAPEPYLETNLDGTIYEANISAGLLLGTTPGFLLGKPLMVFVHADDLPHFRKFVAARRSTKDVAEFPMRVLSRTKDVRAVSASVAASHNGEGAVVSLLWLLHRLPSR